MKTVHLLEQIREYARERGLSMKAMADEIGVPPTTYRGWFEEGGKKGVSPSRTSLAKIRRFLSEKASRVTPPAHARQDGPEPVGEGDYGIPGPGSAAKSARERTRRIRQILVLLEGELSAFRDGPPSVREVFRAELDPDDVGYISSLLTMLGDENKFARWRDLTTNRFHRFGRRKKRDE